MVESGNSDRSKESLKEDIKFLTEIFRFLSITLLAIGGGTASLMFRERTDWAVAFTAMGLVALVGLAMRYTTYSGIFVV
jgi:hypothetical protein